MKRGRPRGTEGRPVLRAKRGNSLPSGARELFGARRRTRERTLASEEFSERTDNLRHHRRTVGSSTLRTGHSVEQDESSSNASQDARDEHLTNSDQTAEDVTTEDHEAVGDSRGFTAPQELGGTSYTVVGRLRCSSDTAVPFQGIRGHEHGK